MPCANPPEHCGCTHAAARARCATWTDWCAPGDRQEDVWLIRFDDNDVADKIFFGDEAECDARQMWESMCGRNGGQWNGYLFQLAQTLTNAERIGKNSPARNPIEQQINPPSNGDEQP